MDILAYSLALGKAKAYADQAIQHAEELGFEVILVNVLPTTGLPKKLYLVPKQQEGQEDIRDEYLWVNNAWEKIGSTAVVAHFDSLNGRPKYMGQTMTSETNVTVPTRTSDIANDSGYQNATQVGTTVSNAVSTAKTEIEAEIPEVVDNATSTAADKALSAKQGKALNDRIDNLNARGRFLSSWNATTGLPGTQPTSALPYTYKTGDYFIVSTVGATNYKPSGTSYSGVASTVVETATVAKNDTYLYDGSAWVLIHTDIPEVPVDDEFDTTSRNPVENRVIANAIGDLETLLEAI